MSSAALDQKSSPKYADLDQVGMTASLLCAIHCAAMPMVITLLSLLGLGFLANEATEWGLIGISLLLGVGSLCLGFRRHRRRRALMILATGFALLASGRIAEVREREHLGVALIVMGGITVAGSHLVNRRLCRSCRVCHSPSETEPLLEKARGNTG
jgi:hypothetical protein